MLTLKSWIVACEAVPIMQWGYSLSSRVGAGLAPLLCSIASVSKLKGLDSDMSVKDRIEDARILWENDRIEGAVIQVLIAVAGTVRKRYPKPMGDSKAFKKFVIDEIEKITNGPTRNIDFYFRGNPHTPLEDIIYSFMRCTLVHEGCLPSDFTLTQPVPGHGKPRGRSPDGTPYDCKLINVLALNDVLGFPVGWVWNLVRVVAEAPENKGEFPDGKYPLPEGYATSAWLILRVPDEHPERFPPNAPARVS